MNRQPLINLQKILTKLYEDERSIRRIVSDAGITSSTMYIDAHALNSWHSVLTEAEKHHQVETLLKAVENEFGNNQESSSEAVNAWAGLILWGEVTGDIVIRLHQGVHTRGILQIIGESSNTNSGTFGACLQHSE